MIFSCSAAMFIGSTWKGSCPVNMAYRFIPLKVHLLASDLMIVVATLIHDTCFNVPNEMNVRIVNDHLFLCHLDELQIICYTSIGTLGVSVTLGQMAIC